MSSDMIRRCFFSYSGPLKASRITSLCACVMSDDSCADVCFSDVSTLKDASASDVSFLGKDTYHKDLSLTKAGACFVREADRCYAPSDLLLFITPYPYAAYAKLAEFFYPRAYLNIYNKQNNIQQPTAIVDETAHIDPSVSLGAYCVVGAGAIIEKNTIISMHSVIGPHCRIGENVFIGPHAAIACAIVGNECIIHAGVRIGQDGFGFAPTDLGVEKIPQLGYVSIGNNVEIGANTAIDRGSLGGTYIGCYTRIDNLVHIAHNVRIGRYCFVMAQNGIAGGAELKDRVVIFGQCGVGGHLCIGEGATLLARSGLSKNIPAGEVWFGMPACSRKSYCKKQQEIRSLLSKCKKS